MNLNPKRAPQAQGLDIYSPPPPDSAAVLVGILCGDVEEVVPGCVFERFAARDHHLRALNMTWFA